MKNFPVKVDGKEYWISRSVAVAVSIYTFIDGKLCILANKRGTGLPNHAGQWNVISGYIDYDETLEQACYREVFEETGLNIKGLELRRMDIEDSPLREGQVILFRYIGFYYDKETKVTLTNKYSEPNEVEEIKFIPIKDLKKYEWTSKNHMEKIKEYANYILNYNAAAKTIQDLIESGNEKAKTWINYVYE